MICPKCKQENPAEARFCNSCGAEIARVSRSSERSWGKAIRDTVVFLVVVTILSVVGFAGMRLLHTSVFSPLRKNGSRSDNQPKSSRLSIQASCTLTTVGKMTIARVEGILTNRGPQPIGPVAVRAYYRTSDNLRVGVDEAGVHAPIAPAERVAFQSNGARIAEGFPPIVRAELGLAPSWQLAMTAGGLGALPDTRTKEILIDGPSSVSCKLSSNVLPMTTGMEKSLKEKKKQKQPTRELVEPTGSSVGKAHSTVEAETRSLPHSPVLSKPPAPFKETTSGKTLTWVAGDSKSANPLLGAWRCLDAWYGSREVGCAAQHVGPLVMPAPGTSGGLQMSFDPTQWSYGMEGTTGDRCPVVSYEIDQEKTEIRVTEYNHQGVKTVRQFNLDDTKDVMEPVGLPMNTRMLFSRREQDDAAHVKLGL